MDDLTTIIEKIKTLEGQELLKYWGALIRERRTEGYSVMKDPGLAFYNEIPTEVQLILVDKLHNLTKTFGVNKFIEILGGHLMEFNPTRIIDPENDDDKI